MRQVHRAGEKLFVDYAGKKPRIIDATTGEVIEVELFVAVLGASNYTYVEATRTQQVPDWIASHQRAFGFFGGVTGAHVRDDTPGRHTTNPVHMPKAHQHHLEWTPSRLTEWAARIGPPTQALVAAILADRPHPEQGYRSCLGLLRLGRRYGEARLEAACARALAVGARSYRHVDSILKHGLEHLPLRAAGPSPAGPAPVHEYVRGRDYYQDRDAPGATALGPAPGISGS